MTIQRKVVGLVLLVTTLAGLVFVSLSSTFLLKQFRQVEEDQANQDMARVKADITTSLASLASKNGDWSNWDDSYQFAANRNQPFITTNLPNNSFSQLKVNYIIFFDPAGHIIYGKGVDLKNQTEISVPEDLLDQIHQAQLTNLTLLNAGKTGLLLVDNRPLLISLKLGW